jgi:regulator of protease activity HflC (stomatin/prohibitin superfamily)
MRKKEQQYKLSRIKRFVVDPSSVGYLYKNCRLKQKLQPGTYTYWDWNDVMRMVSLPFEHGAMYGHSASALSKENVAVRYTYQLTYSITDAERFISHCDLYKEERPDFGSMSVYWFLHGDSIRRTGEREVRQMVEVYLSSKLSSYHCIDIRELIRCTFQQEDTSDVIKLAELNEFVADYGVKVKDLMIYAIEYPHNLQSAFTRNAVAKVQAQTDLEKARASVATTRALKWKKRSMSTHLKWR